MITQVAFRLLSELEANNNKEWFDNHRDQMREHVQDPFQAVLVAATARMANTLLPWRGGKSTMFRMHRDVRFSNNKEPYKASVSGLLTPSGAKAEDDCLAYLHLAPTGSFAACGFYRLEPKALSCIRERIVNEPDIWAGVLNGLNKSGLRLWTEGSLKSMPRGYNAHLAAPYAESLKLKSYVVRIELSRRDWNGGNVVDRLSSLVTSCEGLLHFGAGAASS